MKKLFIYSKTKKTQKGKSFRVFWTTANMHVGDAIVKKSITVKFRQEVDTKSITRGILTVADADIDYPVRYELTTDAEGNKNYPCVWVRAILGFEEKPYVKEDIFVLEDEEDSTDEPVDVNVEPEDIEG